MAILLRLAHLIDWINERVGRLLIWLVLAAVLISAANAIVRKSLSVSSNAYLEAQWYLYSAVFLLGAGYAFLHNVHVRIDVVSSRLSARARSWIDIVGIVLFLIPMCVLLLYLSWPLFFRAWESGELSQSAGGLIRWPVYLMIPAGMALLLAQSIAELIKRIAFVRGLITDPIPLGGHPSPGAEPKGPPGVEPHAP